jgi:cullin-associated NEDD8-dissociated protein 1
MTSTTKRELLTNLLTYRYSDDEDVSWKIRRGAAKVIFVLIGTRNELLQEFYSTTAPVLVSRFNEREESVRVEVLAAFEALLRQTMLAREAELALGSRNKRKRSEGPDEDSLPDDRYVSRCRRAEASVIAFLRPLVPTILRAILKQLSAKSSATRQQCFILLRQLTEALDGGLETEVSAICTAVISALRTADSSSTSSLTIATLSFLSVFFKRHIARSYASHVDDLVSAVIRCMKDKLQRVSFEAFAAASALAEAVRPVSSNGSASPLASAFAQPIIRIFTATNQVLADTSVDGDVREKALETLGSLLVHEGDALSDSYQSCLPLITARLANENTAFTAVQVIGKIAESPICTGSAFDAWLLQVLPGVVIALQNQKSRRSAGQSAEFGCIQNILAKVGSALPVDTAEDIVTKLVPFIDSPSALHIIAILLANQPECCGLARVRVIPAVLQIIKNPTISTSAVHGMTSFFGAYIRGNQQDAEHIVKQLISNLGQAANIPDATQGGTSAYPSTAKCISTVRQFAPQSSILESLLSTIKVMDFLCGTHSAHLRRHLRVPRLAFISHYCVLGRSVVPRELADYSC